MGAELNPVFLSVICLQCQREGGREPSGQVNQLVNQKVAGVIPNQDPLFCEQETLLT